MTEENNTTPDPNAAPNTETPEAAAAEETPAENATDAVFTEPAEDLKSLVAERDESKEKWLRAEAEMENVRRRARTEIDELRKYQALPVLRDVLAPIDNLRLALTAEESQAFSRSNVHTVHACAWPFAHVLADRAAPRRTVNNSLG